MAVKPQSVAFERIVWQTPEPASSLYTVALAGGRVLEGRIEQW